MRWACYKGHTAIAQYLIENHSVNIHFKNNDGDTPLTSAIDNGHTETALYLIEIEKKIAVDESKKQGE